MQGHAQPQSSLRLGGYPQAAGPVLKPKRPSSLSGLMTNYHFSHQPGDTLDEACRRWLDKNGFPARRGSSSKTNDARMSSCCDPCQIRGSRALPSVSTRDGEAMARDGQAFFTLHQLGNQAGETIVEIQFGESFWMLATLRDLDFASPQI